MIQIVSLYVYLKDNQHIIHNNKLYFIVLLLFIYLNLQVIKLFFNQMIKVKL
jgi:hypothetical protein